MSAANTGTPIVDSCSAISCSVFVLPVPVAPAMRPWRLTIAAGIWTTASWWVVPPRTPRPSWREAPSAAYASAMPFPPGYGTRRSLYNLYHVLNHLNLFGAGYLGRAKGMLAELLAIR